LRKKEGERFRRKRERERERKRESFFEELFENY
jgi:hypothetical protein